MSDIPNDQLNLNLESTIQGSNVITTVDCVMFDNTKLKKEKVRNPENFTLSKNELNENQTNPFLAISKPNDEILCQDTDMSPKFKSELSCISLVRELSQAPSEYIKVEDRRVTQQKSVSKKLFGFENNEHINSFRQNWSRKLQGYSLISNKIKKRRPICSPDLSCSSEDSIYQKKRARKMLKSEF